MKVAKVILHSEELQPEPSNRYYGKKNVMSTAMSLPSESGQRLSQRQLGWLGAVTVPLVVGPIWASMTPENWGFLGSFVGFQLIFLLIVSTLTDIRCRKIYNASTYSSFLIVAATSMWANTAGLHSDFLGSNDLGSTLSGAAVCFFIVFLAYQMTGCGAGDVKMATVIGAILGWRLGLTAVGLSYIAAAIAALGSTAWSIGPQRLVHAFGSNLMDSIFQGRMRKAEAPDREILTSTIPMAPFFAIGTIIALLKWI